MIFYLGAQHAYWLWQCSFPLFISRRSLLRIKRPKKARMRWALDSGGFSELSLHGAWQTSASQYIDEVYRYSAEIGNLDWAASQDWMCEPHMLEKTGLSIEEHQRRTVASYLELVDAAPALPWVPVLQGWEMDDYLSCLLLYQQCGVDLASLPVVGLGSVCRRQRTPEAWKIVTTLAAEGINIHLFGFKKTGLYKVHDKVVSADSMAWSYAARRSPPLPGCTHVNCSSCPKYAQIWRSELLQRIFDLELEAHLTKPPTQTDLWSDS